MCLQTKGSLSCALLLQLLLIMQGVSADAGKLVLSQVSFSPSHVLIICSERCRKQTESTQAKSIYWPSLYSHEIASGTLGSRALRHCMHLNQEPGRNAKCSSPSCPGSAAGQPLLSQKCSHHGSDYLLLPRLPLTDLVLCLKDALRSFSKLPPPLHKFPFKEVYTTDSYSFWSGLGNV